MKLKLGHKERIGLVPYVFLAPAILYFLIVNLGTLIYTGAISLQDLSLLNMRDGGEFVGLENYIKLFEFERFHIAIWNTLVYTFFNVIIGCAISLLLAVLIESLASKFLKASIRTISYFPVITSSVAAALIWQFMLETRLGLVNSMLTSVGLSSVSWLTDPSAAMVSVIIVSIWKTTGYRMMLYLNGLQNISNSYYEAATIDGANIFQKFFYITWPLLRPTTAFVLITSFISSFQVFAEIYVLTGGGPGNATITLVQLIYETAFSDRNLGLGSAMSIVMVAVLIIISAINFKVTGGNKAADN